MRPDEYKKKKNARYKKKHGIHADRKSVGTMESGRITVQQADDDGARHSTDVINPVHTGWGFQGPNAAIVKHGEI